MQEKLLDVIGQVRSGQSVLRAHSEQAVVVHACHGHRYQPLPVPLSRTGRRHWLTMII